MHVFFPGLAKKSSNSVFQVSRAGGFRHRRCSLWHVVRAGCVCARSSFSSDVRKISRGERDTKNQTENETLESEKKELQTDKEREGERGGRDGESTERERVQRANVFR